MGIGRKGRNPTGNELPVVSEGTRLSPSHINQIVAAADRATIRGGKGFKFTQTSGGTSLKIDRNDYTPPWSISRFGENLLITAGNVWGKGVGQMPFHTTEEWGFGGADFSKKFWTARPVMVGVDGANIVSTDEIGSEREGEQTRFISMPLLTGYYYIEYGEWGGREDAFSNGVGDDLEGTEQFILKHATSLSATDEVVVIGYVDVELSIYQGVRGDIFWGYADTPPTPFEISVRKVDDEWKMFVAYGTVNNVVPHYETGDEVGNPTADGLSGIGSGNNVPTAEYDIILQLNYFDEEPFPSLDPMPKVYARANWDNTQSTDDECYIKLGRVKSEMVGEGEAATPKFTIEQAVSGSLWVERFKCADNDAIYWVTKV